MLSYCDLCPDLWPAPERVLCVYVQISDLHLSVFYDKQRVTELRQFCQETLMQVIAPEVVLVTGESAEMCTSLVVLLNWTLISKLSSSSWDVKKG